MLLGVPNVREHRARGGGVLPSWEWGMAGTAFPTLRVACIIADLCNQLRKLTDLGSLDLTN